MLQVVAQLLPFAVAGAFLPSWTSRVIILLGTERPLSTASAYVAGNATWRLGLGLAAVFVASLTAPEAAGRGITIPVGVAWAAAVSFAVAGIWLTARKPRAEQPEAAKPPRWVNGLKRFPPWAAFGYGVYNCALPGAQWAYFLGGCGAIAASGFAWGWKILLLVVFVAVLEVMLIAPIALFAFKRDRAQAGLARLDKWLARHSATVTGGILIMIGAIFAYIALTGGQVVGHASMRRWAQGTRTSPVFECSDAEA